MMSCWHSALKHQFWNSRAAFGLGAFLNMPFGPTISGVPSLA